MAEKTEKATPWKLQKAREKGVVGKSLEPVHACVLLGIILWLHTQWPGVQTLMARTLQVMLATAGGMTLSPETACRMFGDFYTRILPLWLLAAMLTTGCAIAGTWLQTGVIWSVKALRPDAGRLHLMKGVKQLCSLQSVHQLIRHVLKLVIATGVGYWLWTRTAPQWFLMRDMPPERFSNAFLTLFCRGALLLLLPLAGLAILDVLAARWRHLKSQRMSRHEVREEYRQREGDPHVRGRIRKLQRALREKTRALGAVKTADVVITNPVHLAIALKYQSDSMPAPKVVCKAADEQAALVRRLARRHGVPIVENRDFARLLYHNVPLNHWIHTTHYPVAAAIFRALREAHRGVHERA
ncbi:flagellar biosynthetic protein FlhB [Legionella geestiana]|uniref:Flagellar biosynthetic protein FlhB n=1 Tax=Legionella geestiana TaxID=45065 RepID=A0A0W0TTP5_9GAMM|nr:EscU/YscU/HrcU family type III secretion system export apparatus switch protein [Legionella geestiana]KTC99012.1 flagellar biosynthetic protein FlhB [Legionella geestiana]QBS12654.1 EscU/YscU/HrcU family type III secretion system export apparatus switch protein [Legionella geestiana]STX54884.1 flagellar biosynthetic protein FlhB [Legionella geestiana]